MITALIASALFLPNPSLTPGVADSNATVNMICTSGYTKQVRAVSNSTRHKVFSLYNVDPKSDKFEVDHLIPLELGGSNDIKNLWPQSYTSQPWNAKLKDRIENKLNDLVCSGQMQLKDAQAAISKNWIEIYKHYFK